MKNILCFVLGAGIGTVVTWKILEKKYRELAEEEIDSVREFYQSRLNDDNQSIDANEETSELIIGEGDSNIEIQEESVNKINYNKIINKENYTDENEEESDDLYSVELEDENQRTEPFVISPDDFGSLNHYGTKTLTYYADDVLTDEIDVKIENRDIVVGKNFIDGFGEYEDDAVHIRDIDNEMDYEILKSDELFSSIKRSDD